MSGAGAAPRRCTGVILAGGAATRYGGRPKGLELVQGRRIVDRVVEALRPACDDLLLVANHPAADRWLPGVRTLPDIRPGEGALGGLHAALSHAGSDILLVAWDMPFVPAALLGALRARGEREDADAVLPESDGSRRGVEPLCAWYAAACLAPVTAALEAGDRRVIAFLDAVRVARLPLTDVAAFGDPSHVFRNVNTPEDLGVAERAHRTPPMVAIVGRKHAGKTTMTARLSAELTRRGHRVMILKHGAHTFNLDPAGTDTYRHYHEGNAERVAMAAPDKFALVMRWERELGPEALAARYFGDANIVLCEGFKASALPKIEVFRRAAHETSLWADAPSNADTWRAMVSDADVPAFPGTLIRLDTVDPAAELADWVEHEIIARPV